MPDSSDLADPAPTGFAPVTQDEPSAATINGVRIDKWLWAARLTKTRGVAADALKGGRVTINGVVAKPAREVKPGDEVEIRLGPVRRTVTVDALSERRVSAALAAGLYTEAPESIKAREAAAEQRRLMRPRFDDGGGRPTKRDRRRLERERGSR